MKLKQVLYLFIIALLASCKQGETDGVQTIHFPAADNHTLAEQFSAERFIQLETTDECLVGEVTDMQWVGDYLYVLDFRFSKSLFQFDLNGRFVQKIAAAGDGPGQYVMPRSFSIDAEKRSLYILDVAVGKMLEYNLDSFAFIGESPVGGVSLFSHNNLFYLYDPMPATIGTETKPFYVHCYDKQLNYQASSVSIAFETGYVMGPNRRMSLFEGRVRFIPPFSNQVVDITNGTERPVYNLTFAQGEIPPLSFLTVHKDNLPKSLMENSFIVQFDVMEESSFILAPYASYQELYIGIYNKATQTARSFVHSEKESWLSVFKPKGTRGKSVLFVTSGDDITAYATTCPNSLTKLLDERREGDNPIVMLADVRLDK